VNSIVIITVSVSRAATLGKIIDDEGFVCRKRTGRFHQSYLPGKVATLVRFSSDSVLGGPDPVHDERLILFHEDFIKFLKGLRLSTSSKFTYLIKALDNNNRILGVFADSSDHLWH
jgi:hypothetical protein